MKIKAIRVVDSSAAQVFQDLICAQLKVELPLDYIEHNAFWISDGSRIVATFLVNPGPQYNLTQFFPSKVIEELEEKVGLENCVEIHALWFSGLLKGRANLRVWFLLAVEILKTNKKYLLFSRVRQNKNIKRIHDSLRPVHFCTADRLGTQGIQAVEFFYCNRFNLLMSPLWGLGNILRRLNVK